MFILLVNDYDILGLSVDQLQYIPKKLLLDKYGDFVDRLWERLPAHLQNDSDVQRYRLCHKHHNQPWQDTHIDGPPPLIKDCGMCARNETA